MVVVVMRLMDMYGYGWLVYRRRYCTRCIGGEGDIRLKRVHILTIGRSLSVMYHVD